MLDQTDPGFELIIVDDGSVDNSLAVALAIAAIDDRIRVVSQQNAGPAQARNLGIELARGTLLAFLDADDIWHEEKLACHRAFHSVDPAAGVSYARIAASVQPSTGPTIYNAPSSHSSQVDAMVVAISLSAAACG